MSTRVKPSEMSQETRVGKALGHPLRAEILARLNEQTHSPKELAKLVGQRIENVAYHVRVLLELGCIELVDTAPRRGATEHYYRALERAFLSEADWVKLPPNARRGFTQRGLKISIADVLASFDAGTFDRRADHHNTFTRLVLDEDGFSELADEMMALLDKAMLIEAASVGRLQNGEQGGAEVRARLLLMQYEPPPLKKTRT